MFYIALKCIIICRLLLGLNKKSQLSDYSNTNTSDHGYDSYSVSSSDSYPSVNGSPVKLDPRMTQIPEDWQPEEDNDLDKKLKLVTEDTNGTRNCSLSFIHQREGKKYNLYFTLFLYFFKT